MIVEFVDNWRSWWKWISTWCFAAIAAGHSALSFIPTDQQIKLLQQHGPFISYVTVALAFCGFFGRMINQSPTDSTETKQ